MRKLILILLLIPLVFAAPAPVLSLDPVAIESVVVVVAEEDIQVMYDGDTDGTYYSTIGDTVDLTVEMSESGTYYVQYASETKTIVCKSVCTETVTITIEAGTNTVQVRESRSSYEETGLTFVGVGTYDPGELIIDIPTITLSEDLLIDIDVPEVEVIVVDPILTYGALTFVEDTYHVEMVSCTETMVLLETDLPEEVYMLSGHDILIEWTPTEDEVGEYTLNVECGDVTELVVVVQSNGIDDSDSDSDSDRDSDRDSD